MSSLSDTQREFMCFVERQVGEGEALFQADLDTGLPGDTVRVSIETTNVAGDVTELVHTVEFMSLTGDAHWESIGRIGHALGSFELAGAGFPDSGFATGEVERLVQAQLEKLKAARLLPLAAAGPHARAAVC